MRRLPASIVTIITAISIPLSLLIALIGLQLGDYSLNIFTLAAMTVAVGRVVDDSIVVVENIKRRATGHRTLTTGDVVASVKEVAGAVTASTLTTVTVFAPVAIVSGVVGELFRPFAITVAVALGASLLVSMTIVPVLAYWFLRWRRRDLLNQRWFLWFAVLAGPLAVVCMESGWIATEVGRQPWTVWEVLRTEDAAGDNPDLWWVFGGVVVVYTGMTIGAYLVLRSMARRWRAGQRDLPSPYGPESAAPPEKVRE